jgi:hypothetical protein
MALRPPLLPTATDNATARSQQTTAIAVDEDNVLAEEDD